MTAKVTITARLSDLTDKDVLNRYEWKSEGGRTITNVERLDSGKLIATGVRRGESRTRVIDKSEEFIVRASREFLTGRVIQELAEKVAK